MRLRLMLHLLRRKIKCALSVSIDVKGHMQKDSVRPKDEKTQKEKKQGLQLMTWQWRRRPKKENKNRVEAATDPEHLTHATVSSKSLTEEEQDQRLPILV